jgi:excisionase family DNA binding protein
VNGQSQPARRLSDRSVLIIAAVGSDTAVHLADAIRKQLRWAKSSGVMVPTDLARIEETITLSVRERLGETRRASSDGGVHDQWEEPLAVTYSEAAQTLSVSKRTISRMIQRGELTPVTVGGVKRIPTSELTRITEQKERPP